MNIKLPDNLDEIQKLRFCIWLRKRVFKRGLTYQELATHVGSSPGSICNHMNGTYFPSYERMIKYFNLFKVSDKAFIHARMYEIFRQVEDKYRLLKRLEEREKRSE